MKFTKVFLCLIFLFSTNLAIARSRTLADALRDNIPSEYLKGFHFVDGNILFHSGAVGSVYKIKAVNPGDLLKENWIVFGNPGYTDEDLTDFQKKEIKNGYSYAEIILPVYKDIKVTDTELNNFGTKVVVPRIAGLIDAGANLDISKINTVDVTVDKLFKRKLKDQKYFEYIKQLPDGDQLKNLFLNGKLAVVTEDYLAVGFTTTVCNVSEFEAGLKVQLGGLELFSNAFSKVMAALGNTIGSDVPPVGNEGNMVPLSNTTNTELLALVEKEIDLEAVNDPNEMKINIAHKMAFAHLGRLNPSSNAFEGPGFGIKFKHLSDKCFAVSTDDPVIVARKIVAQRKEAFRGTFVDPLSELEIDEDMQNRRSEHWGNEYGSPRFDWVILNGTNN